MIAQSDTSHICFVSWYRAQFVSIVCRSPSVFLHSSNYLALILPFEFFSSSNILCICIVLWHPLVHRSPSSSTHQIISRKWEWLLESAWRGPSSLLPLWQPRFIGSRADIDSVLMIRSQDLRFLKHSNLLHSSTRSLFWSSCCASSSVSKSPSLEPLGELLNSWFFAVRYQRSWQSMPAQPTS